MKFLLKILLVFTYLSVHFIIADERNSQMLKCRKSNSDYQNCILTNLLKFIPGVLKGIPEYNIPKSDPLDIPQMLFNRSLTEQTTIIANLRNLRFTGYSDLQIRNVTITNLRDLSGEISVFYPVLNLTMDHFFGGTLFSIPLEMEGKFRGTFINDFTRMKVKFKSIEKGGQTYYAIDKVKLSDYIADARIQVTAKNPENQPFTDFMNNLINNNPRTVLDVFSLMYLEPCENILRLIVDRALAKVPAEKLFVE